MRGMYFMKGIVFSFKKRYLFRRSKGISPSDVRFFIRRYSVVLIFVSAFLTGLVFGSIYAQRFSGYWPSAVLRAMASTTSGLSSR